MEKKFFPKKKQKRSSPMIFLEKYFPKNVIENVYVDKKLIILPNKELMRGKFVLLIFLKLRKPSSSLMNLSE